MMSRPNDAKSLFLEALPKSGAGKILKRELRQRYEKAALETAARYDWPAIGERFQEVLQSVIRQKNAKRGAVAARTA